MKWQGKRCVVTGASSGFGVEIAKLLAGKGAEVIAVARRRERLEALVEELGGEPHSFEVCDISSLEEIRKLASILADKFPHIDVLINNAGIPGSGPFGEASSEEIERVIKTNLLGPMLTTRELLHLVEAAPKAERTPVVVNVSSIAGRVPTPRLADYAASKFGLVGFTEAAWHDLKPRGIRSMVVNPGLADTEGFPMDRIRKNPLVAWTVMDASRVAKALIGGIERGSFEVRVQWWMHPLYHVTVALGPLRRLVSGALQDTIDDAGKR
ncbi:MAG TPA: SDR family NAD(P)-dependent oxidoreductase [Actinomycetota bacterium]|nr:SDR family NAD(P)-dependent oxidoreductase [Actinomycetota bacterium]